MTTVICPQTSELTRKPLTAFCATRPEPEAVAQVLQNLGFQLVFALEADHTCVVAGYPPLPAQYHYADHVGTEVAYLDGVDASCLADDDDDPEAPSLYHYPSHASRFWLTPGAHELASKRTQETLAGMWNLRWLELQTVQPIRGAA